MLNHSTQDSPPVATYTTSGDDKFVDKRYENIKSDVVEITHDKLENVLLKFYRKHLLRTAWFNPLSFVIALSLTLTTAEFKIIALGLEGTTWKAMFILALLASSLWLFWILVQLVVNWKETSLESLINRIKNVSDKN